jgi:hypothetical protein
MGRSEGGLWKSGVWAVAPNGGGPTLLISRGAWLSSFTVMRDESGDQVLLNHEDLTIAHDCTPGVVCHPPGIERVDLAGNPTGQAAFITETIGFPGEPGLVRIDGRTPASRRPFLSFNGEELRDLRYLEVPSTFGAAAISAFGARAGSELVTGTASWSAFGQGREPDQITRVCVSNALQPSPICPTVAGSGGELEISLALAEGFNTVSVSSDPGDSSPPLLVKRVLRLAAFSLLGD